MKVSGVFLICLVFFAGCNNKPEWIKGENDERYIDWTGSWPNGYEKLMVISHQWKLFKDEEKWAFRVKIAYPKNRSDDSTIAASNKRGELWASDPYVISVNRIIYRVYDKDDFLIDSAIIESGDVLYNDTSTFQLKKSMSVVEMSKVAYGKVNIQAGEKTQFIPLSKVPPWEETTDQSSDKILHPNQKR